MKVRSLISAATVCRCFAACLSAVLSCAAGAEEESSSLVLRNGRSIPLSALAVERGNFVLKSAAGSFGAGQSFPISAASHVSERPPEIDRALGLLLIDRPEEAVKLLDPVLDLHKITAPVPENFWIDAARVSLLTAAWTGDTAKTEEYSKEIASIADGRYKNDLYLRLAEVLVRRGGSSGKDERLAELGSLVDGTAPDDINALASYFRGKLFQKARNNEPALEAFLTVGCIYPAGGLTVVSAAELNAADLLVALERQDEAAELLESAVSGDKGGPIAAEAAKRLETFK